MFCEECGEQLEDGLQFCTNCGCKIDVNDLQIIPGIAFPATDTEPEVMTEENEVAAEPEVMTEENEVAAGPVLECEQEPIPIAKYEPPVEIVEEAITEAEMITGAEAIPVAEEMTEAKLEAKAEPVIEKDSTIQAMEENTNSEKESINNKKKFLPFVIGGGAIAIIAMIVIIIVNVVHSSNSTENSIRNEIADADTESEGEVFEEVQDEDEVEAGVEQDIEETETQSVEEPETVEVNDAVPDDVPVVELPETNIDYIHASMDTTLSIAAEEDSSVYALYGELTTGKMYGLLEYICTVRINDGNIFGFWGETVEYDSPSSLHSTSTVKNRLTNIIPASAREFYDFLGRETYYVLPEHSSGMGADEGYVYYATATDFERAADSMFGRYYDFSELAGYVSPNEYGEYGVGGLAGSVGTSKPIVYRIEELSDNRWQIYAHVVYEGFSYETWDFYEEPVGNVSVIIFKNTNSYYSGYSIEQFVDFAYSE